MLGYYDVTKIQNPEAAPLHGPLSGDHDDQSTSILAIRSETEENLKKKKELWAVSEDSRISALYLRLRWGFLGQGINLPGKGGRKAVDRRL